MKNSGSSTASGWPVTSTARFALFAGIGVLAIFVAGALVNPYLPGILIGAIFAPWGLAFLIPGISDTMLSSSVAVGWFIYLGLVIVGTLTINRRLWLTVFIIFLALVLLNMGGCVAYCHANSPGGNCFDFSSI